MIDIEPELKLERNDTVLMPVEEILEREQEPEQMKTTQQDEEKEPKPFEGVCVVFDPSIDKAKRKQLGV